METTIEYCRTRSSEPIVFLGLAQKLDWFQVLWQLEDPELIHYRKERNAKDVQRIEGIVVIARPLRHIKAEIVLLDGVLAQLSLIFATPVNTSPIIESRIVTSVIRQICEHGSLKKTNNPEESAIRKNLRAQIANFIKPITKHTKHYARLRSEGREILPYTLSPLP